MVKVSHAINASSDILKGSVSSPRFEAELLVSYVLEKDKLGLLMCRDEMINKKDYEKIITLSYKRAESIPLAYITGKKEFMSLDFEVNENVLIPRPETEELVSLVIEMYQGKKAKILDLCTGSGAICCSLAYYLKDAACVGADISIGALDVAQKNAKSLGVDARAKFICHDVLNPDNIEGDFDVVVSNPPYIESDLIQNLENDVKNNEPILALDGGSDGLKFYREIIKNIDLYLKNGGMLLFEIGYNQGEALKNLLKDRFEDIKVIKDLSGHDRIVTARLG